MADVIFPAGTTATLQYWLAVDTITATGTSVTLANVKTITANEGTLGFGDTTPVSQQGNMVKRPSKRIEPGTFSITFFLDDTTTGTNQYKVLKDRRLTYLRNTVTLNLPGSFDDATSPLDPLVGFISGITTPEISQSDEGLTYTVNFQVTGVIIP
jgi:hypothetical protein